MSNKLIAIVLTSLMLQGCAMNNGPSYGSILRAEEARTVRIIEAIEKQNSKPTPVYRWENTIKIKPKAPK